MLHQPTAFMQAQEIADALGMERSTFLRKRKGLIIDEGMPAPLPGHSLRWHRAGVEKWLAQYGEVKARAMRGSGSMIRISLDREALTAAYASSNAA